jgi:hypothetical protein
MRRAYKNQEELYQVSAVHELRIWSTTPYTKKLCLPFLIPAVQTATNDG